MTRFLIVGDLHGAKPEIYFDKSEFDAIIAPGDVCSDKELRESTNLWIQSWKKKSKTVNADWEEYIDKVYGRKRMEREEKRSLKEGRKIMKYLASFGKPVFFVPGNWDQSYGHSRISIKKQDESNFYLGL